MSAEGHMSSVANRNAAPLTQETIEKCCFLRTSSSGCGATRFEHHLQWTKQTTPANKHTADVQVWNEPEGLILQI